MSTKFTLETINPNLMDTSEVFCLSNDDCKILVSLGYIKYMIDRLSMSSFGNSTFGEAQGRLPILEGIKKSMTNDMIRETYYKDLISHEIIPITTSAFILHRLLDDPDFHKTDYPDFFVRINDQKVLESSN